MKTDLQISVDNSLSDQKMQIPPIYTSCPTSMTSSMTFHPKVTTVNVLWGLHEMKNQPTALTELNMSFKACSDVINKRKCLNL